MVPVMRRRAVVAIRGASGVVVIRILPLPPFAAAAVDSAAAMAVAHDPAAVVVVVVPRAAQPWTAAAHPNQLLRDGNLTVNGHSATVLGVIGVCTGIRVRVTTAAAAPADFPG